jgi:hypothetical protein
MGLARLDYVRSMVFQSTTKFLLGSSWVHVSLLFVADKFGDLSLPEPESPSQAPTTSPPALVRVGLINEAELKHISNALGKTDTDPSRDKVGHN